MFGNRFVSVAPRGCLVNLWHGPRHHCRALRTNARCRWEHDIVSTRFVLVRGQYRLLRFLFTRVVDEVDDRKRIHSFLFKVVVLMRVALYY